MKRILFAILVLTLVLPAVGWAQAPEGAQWLSFDGKAPPGAPRLELLATEAEAIELRADTPGAWAETVKAGGRIWSRLGGDGYGHPAAYGLPDLPVLRSEVEIPAGATARLELVAAEFEDSSLAELGLQPLYPLQPPVPKLPGARENAPFVVDEGWYAAGSGYPSGPLSLGEAYTVRGRRIQPMEVWPVIYDPAASTVRTYSRLTFRLVLEGGDAAQTEALTGRYASPAFERSLSRRVLNYEPSGAGGVRVAVGYLIIAADATHDATVPLANLRAAQGFDVTLTRLSDVPGTGTAADIKAYVQDAYDNWPTPPSYLLLVGDTDTIPTWTGSSANEATDLYYVTMDGTTDYHPDLGRGRFPVRSVAQAEAVVAKYLTYAGFTGAEAWLKKAAFIASCDDYVTAEGTHNYVSQTHTEPGGYAGIFPNSPEPGGDKIYCITYGGSATNIRNAAHDGRWAIIYSGHGSTTGWADGAVSFSQTDVRNLTDLGFYPFVASHACVTGQFDVTEAYAETWLLQAGKGALAVWASADNSYWDEDDTLERAMFDSLFAGAPGEASPYPDVTGMTYDGLAAVESAHPSSARYYWETYNIMGDPAVKIFMEPDLATFTLSVAPDAHELCASGSVTSTVEIGSILNYSETVHLAAGPLPGGMGATFAPASAAAPYSSTLTLDVAPGTPGGDYGLVVTATDLVSFTQEAPVDVRLMAGPPGVPAPLSPPDGATNQPLRPDFSWAAVPTAGSYGLQLDRSPLFGAPIIDEDGLVDPAYTPADGLTGGRCYWWRAGAANVCGAGTWADAAHFATVALDVVFGDDMEAGDGNWSHGTNQGADGWTLSTDQSHSPSHAWHVPDAGTVTDSFLWNSAPVALGAGSRLTFWHRHQFESSFDGGVLEISTDGGGTWLDLGPRITASGYNGVLSNTYGNPLGGRAAWVGDVTDWTQVEVDLSTFAGQSARFRWRLGCDSSVSDVGWYIDDVQVTAPLPAADPPLALSIAPSAGSAYEDTPVVIEGSGFVDTPSARLGDTWLLSVTQVSSTSLEAVVPAGLAGGTYTLTLYNGGDCAQAELAGAYASIEDCITPTVSLDGDSQTLLGRPLHLTATLTGTPSFSYTWDFGGPGACEGCDSLTPSYVYTSGGWYTASIEVENACGEDAAARPVVVLQPVYLPLVLHGASGW